MDITGAQALAARIKAGVSVGSRIELVSDSSISGLRAGDRGVVLDITAEGCVVAVFRDGVNVEIDPELTPYRTLAA
jgi:hypothetical protein